MLTGESIPVIKYNMPNDNAEIYTVQNTAKHTLFGGTKVIQTRAATEGQPVMGLVTSTGFLTTKGGLVRNILYPKEVNLQLNTDSMKFVGIMAGMTMLVFLGTLPLTLKSGLTTSEIVFRSLDLITITVPAALPVAMTCGIAFAIQRLKE